MARNTPPTLISYTEIAYTTATTTSIVSASISWQTGDVIVVEALCESATALGTPTATGLTFTSQKSNSAASSCASQCATAVAASASSSAVTITRAGTPHAGAGIWVWRGSDGVGASVEGHTTAKTVSLVLTDTHSAVCWGVGDFNADAITTIAPTPTATNERERSLDTGKYSIYSWDLIDNAGSGATSFGFTGTPTAGPYSQIAVEILGTTVAASSPPILVTTRLGGV